MKTLTNKLRKCGRWRAGILRTESINTGNAKRSYTNRFSAHIHSNARIRTQIKMAYNREEVCGRGS